MSLTDRLQAAIHAQLEEQRRSLDTASSLSTVQIIVQINRLGQGKDRVLVRTESGHLPNGR